MTSSVEQTSDGHGIRREHHERHGRTLLLTSHDTGDMEQVCDRVIVLHQGNVVADDSIARLRTLMSSSSLEGVFSQLVIRDDPERIARELADVSALGA